MARVIWTVPALSDLEAIAEYIALDNGVAASRFVQTVFDRTEQLEAHPNSGRRPPELKRTHYRELVIPPCRLFYRVENDFVYVLYVMRSERILREHLLERREKPEPG
jgi:toxin ParE1/3/4